MHARRLSRHKAPPPPAGSASSMAALMDSGDATMAIRSHVVSSVTRTITLDDAGVVALMEIVGVTSKAGDRVNIEYLKQGRKPIIVKKSFLCVTDAENTVQERARRGSR